MTMPKMESMKMKKPYVKKPLSSRTMLKEKLTNFAAAKKLKV